MEPREEIRWIGKALRIHRDDLASLRACLPPQVEARVESIVRSVRGGRSILVPLGDAPLGLNEHDRGAVLDAILDRFGVVLEPPSSEEWVTESYTPTGETALAQELYDTGLLALVNYILHPHGLALGVNVEPDGRVTGLNLHETADPEGIWFDEELTRLGRAKLFAAGLLRRRRVRAT